MIPTLTAGSLLLRPFTMGDAPIVQLLVGDQRVSRYLLHVPYPYPDGAAETWIATHHKQFVENAGVTFAICTAVDGILRGAIGLELEPTQYRATMGYWIGFENWGRGIASVASKAVIGFGFDTLGLNRIMAEHMAANPASGRVMVKAGMQYEGRLRQHVFKDERFEDALTYAIVRQDCRPVNIPL